MTPEERQAARTENLDTIRREQIVTTDVALARVPHLPPGKAQLILVTGMRGNGKSVFVGGMPDGTAPMGYIETCEPRVFVLDIHDDYGRVRRRSDWRFALEEYAATDGPIRRRVVPEPEEGQTLADWGDAFFAEFERYAKEGDTDGLLVVEELSTFVRSTNVKGTPFEQIVMQGRHWGVRVLAVAQRLNRLPGELHSEATQIIAYRTIRPRDCEVLEDWGCREAREIAPTLQPGECYLVES